MSAGPAFHATARWLWLAAKYGILAAVLYWLSHSGWLRWEQLQALAADWTLVLGACSAIAATIVLGAWRWHVLMRCQGIPLGLGPAIRFYYIGQFFNNVLPGAVGGDVVRAGYTLLAAPGHRVAATLSIVADRMIGLFGVLIVAALGVVPNLRAIHASPHLRVAGAVVVAAAAGVAVVFFVSLSNQRRTGISRWIASGSGLHGVRDLVVRVLDGIAHLRGQPVAVVGSLALAVLVQAMLVVIMFVISQRTGHAKLEFEHVAFVMPLSILVTTVPITPGGLGIGEAAFDQISRLISGDPELTGVATLFLAYRIMVALASLPGLVMYLNGARLAGARTSGRGAANRNASLG